MNQQIILASQSPRRQELLARSGLEFITETSMIDEKMTKEAPWDVVMELSEQKALDVFKNHADENVLVIGADTVVSYENHVLGKPKSEEEAVGMLRRLQGGIHQVYTGVSIIWTKNRRAHTFCEKTEVEVYPMTDQEIRSYVESGEGMDKAGAYGIQTRFCVYVKQIHGDYNNVVGLPTARLYHELKRMNLV